MIVRNRLFPFMFLILASSCVTEKGEVSVKLPGAKTFKENQIHNATVTNVQIQNDQLIITGNNLNIITDVKTENADKSFMHNFVIETKSQNQIIAKSTSPISLVANSLLKLIISNSYGATTFDISFNLCDSTLNGRALDCTVAANDRDVLSYDATTQTWKPRAVNGLNYLGSFDASSGSAPTAQPSGSYYIISVAGTISGINFEIGDWIVSNGAAYQKIDNSTAITSVFGRTGAVTALEGDYSLDKLLDVDLTIAPVAGKVLKYDGSKWVAGDDLSGGGAGSVTSTEITDGAIATVDIANGAVTDAKINDVAAGKISGTLTGTQIGAGVITNSHIAAGAAIDYSKLNIPAGSIPYSQLNIAAGEIPQDRINGLSTSLSALIEDSIVDIVTNKAPSQNAVYDALALKADRTNVSQTMAALAVTGLGAPVANSDAANKQYVDTQRDTRVLKTGDTMSGDLTLDTNLRLKGGANYVTVRANAATANYTLSLPTTAGTAGYVLQTDGAGALSWINPSSTTAGTSTVNSAAITDGSIVDADINASANIAQSKIAGLTTDLANKQPLDSGLTNLAAYNTNGILVQTANDTFVGRSIAGTANRITITNADGVAGNPTLNLDTSLLPSPVVGDVGKWLKATAANTSVWTSLASADITTALGFTPINKAGDTITTGTVAFNTLGTLSIGYTPTNLTDATSKSYVDNAIASAPSSWTSNAGNVYRTTGSVGIGTSTPTSPLHVKNNTGTNDGITIENAGAISPSLYWYRSDTTVGSKLWRARTNSNTSWLLEITDDSKGTPVEAIHAIRSGASVTSVNFPNGKVGIGTTTPNNSLSVHGTEKQIRIQDTDDATGVWAIGTVGADNRNLNFIDDNINIRMTIHEAGNVGIGTTTPAQKLDVSGTIKTGNATSVAGSTMIVDNYTNGNLTTIGTEQSSGSPVIGYGVIPDASIGNFLSSTPTPLSRSAITVGGIDGIRFYQGSSQTVATNSAVTMSEVMRITQLGKVGIGANNPSNILHLNNSAGEEGAPGIFIQDPTTTAAYGGQLYYEDRSGANALKLSALENGTESGYLAIDRTSGKIGIGTTSPVGQLQIGQSNMTGSPGAPIESRRLSIGTHTHTGATFDVFQRDMTDHAYLDFRYAGTTPIMTFKGSGQVSFGTQSVSSHLLVSSNSPNAYTSLGFENTAAGGNKWNFLAGATGSPLGANRMCLETGGVCRLNVDTTGNLNIGGTLTQSSDRRLKTEIEIIPDSLDKLLTLNGVTYFWKESKNGTDKQMGLIAQEVEKVFPEAIKKDNLGMLSVAYQNLVGPIINSIKEIYRDYLVPLIKNDKTQDRKIASLEVENKKLKEENALFKEYLCQKDPKANFCQEKKSKSSKP